MIGGMDILELEIRPSLAYAGKHGLVPKHRRLVGYMG